MWFDLAAASRTPFVWAIRLGNRPYLDWIGHDMSLRDTSNLQTDDQKISDPVALSRPRALGGADQ